MRRLVCLVLLGIAALGMAMLSVTAYAQSSVCAESINVFQGNCSNQFCQDVYPLTTTNPCSPFDDCFYFTASTYSCCGIGGYYYANDSGGCFLGLLKDKSAKSELFALANKEEILVPSCNGAYVPLVLFRNRLEANRWGGN